MLVLLEVDEMRREPPLVDAWRGHVEIVLQSLITITPTSFHFSSLVFRVSSPRHFSSCHIWTNNVCLVNECVDELFVITNVCTGQAIIMMTNPRI